MFTPPPSPDPYRAKHNLSPEPSPTDDDGFLTVSPSTLPSCLSKPASGQIEDLRHQRKLQTTRRIRWTILLVPAILILITVSTRYISHSTGLSAWPSERSNEWLHLKREPSPEPVPLPQQSSASASSTSSTTQTVPTVPATPPQLPTPFPQALDQSLSTNFSTQGCENFFLNMTSSTAFRTCRPFSLLFQTSSDFVLQAQTNLTALNNIVWGTCNTNTDAGQCSENMAWFAQDLQQECAEDVKENNAVVMQTLKGLQTYDLYRTTACLTDQSTNAYCYVEAVHNTSPADLYFYSLPLGTQLPATVQPSCSPCMKSVMSLFSKSTSNNTALAQVYNGAATIANNACGSGFVTISSTNAARGMTIDEGRVMMFATIVLGVTGGLVLW